MRRPAVYAGAFLLASACAASQPPPPASDAETADSAAADETELTNPGEPPTSAAAELEAATTDYKNWFRITPEQDPLRGLDAWRKSLQTDLGLKVGGAYSMLMQQATGGPGDRTAAAGKLEFLSNWTLPGGNEIDFGRVSFTADYRFQIGDIVPNSLGPEIGTLIPTANSYNERTLVVKEFFYEQRTFEGKLRVLGGRLDMENYVGGHRMQSANLFYLNKAFSGNPTIAYPGVGLAADAAVLPTKWLYIAGAVADANAVTTQSDLDTAFDTGELFAFGEAGILTNIDGWGEGRQRLSYWHIDAREEADKPSDQGVCLTLDQDFGARFTAFARGAYSDADVTGVRELLEAGFALKGVLGSTSDVTGFAAAWASPPQGRDETILEVFHRFQLALRMQFTAGAQLILNPGNAPQDDALGVFSLRFRFSF